ERRCHLLQRVLKKRVGLRLREGQEIEGTKNELLIEGGELRVRCKHAAVAPQYGRRKPDHIEGVDHAPGTLERQARGEEAGSRYVRTKLIERGDRSDLDRTFALPAVQRESDDIVGWRENDGSNGPPAAVGAQEVIEWLAHQFFRGEHIIICEET